MEIRIDRQLAAPLAERAVEVVERKGLGHPDTLCDALAEEVSRALCRSYLERCGAILHHNTDKVLLAGGASQPRFGGGEVREPFEIFLAGRATRTVGGEDIPIHDIAVESCRRWIGEHLHAVDPDRHVRFHSLLRPGSPELVELFLRQRQTGAWPSNDTSCGVGSAPRTPLERLVCEVERRLNGAERRTTHPEVGEDVKVMASRIGARVRLVVACAFVDRHLRDLPAYLEARAAARALAGEVAAGLWAEPVEIEVNAADDPAQGSLFLTVTGTSAEAGDDGEAGRGNRWSGLITPYRPMTIESVAGKNPVSHVGKIYNAVAQEIAERLVEAHPEVREAHCVLVSRIGRPVQEPDLVHLELACPGDRELQRLAPAAAALARAELARVDSLWKDLVAREWL
jgi:S-adenosylmethionine synthetase